MKVVALLIEKNCVWKLVEKPAQPDNNSIIEMKV